MFKKLAQQLKIQRENKANNGMTTPNDFLKKEILNTFTQTALDMYQKRADINKFTKLVLSDPENTSHEKLVEQLNFDPDIDEKLSKLANNTKFLRDLGLM